MMCFMFAQNKVYSVIYFPNLVRHVGCEEVSLLFNYSLKKMERIKLSAIKKIIDAVILLK